LEPETTKN